VLSRDNFIMGLKAGRNSWNGYNGVLHLFPEDIYYPDIECRRVLPP